MKVAFVVQYYPYQYEQFLPLIKALNADVFFRIHTDNPTSYALSYLNTLDGGYVKYNDFEGRNYDALVYTGTECRSLLKFADYCKYKNVIYVTHSLIGSLYDISIVTPTHERSVGIVPHCWEDFSSFKKRVGIIQDEGWSTTYVRSLSHPIAVQALERPPRVVVEENSLAVITGHRSPFKHFSEIVEGLVSKFKISKVKLKLHPLAPDEAQSYFKSSAAEIEFLPKDYDKYDWTDSCKYVIGGCSSLLVESAIRSMYFDTSQNFKQFPFKRRGIPVEMETHDSDSWSPGCPTFSDFVRSPDVTIREYIEIIEKLIKDDPSLEKIVV